MGFPVSLTLVVYSLLRRGDGHMVAEQDRAAHDCLHIDPRHKAREDLFLGAGAGPYGKIVGAFRSACCVKMELPATGKNDQIAVRADRAAHKETFQRIFDLAAVDLFPETGSVKLREIHHIRPPVLRAG